MSSKPAIFVDRDGTLNELVGYLNDIDAFELFPWSHEAIRLINRSGYLAVVVTNQSGVARGIYSEELVRAVHSRMKETLESADARLDGIYYCPHDGSGECDCRKPKPGMLERAEKDLDIDMSRSWVIGDSYSDLELAWNVGARAALVMTGYGRGNYEHHRDSWNRQPDIVAPNLFSAVVEIVWETPK